MERLDTPSRKQKWRRRLNLSGQFTKAVTGFALPGLATMAASTVFPPAGFIVPLAFMVGSHISLGYKVHQQKMVLDNTDDFLSLSGALKVGIREKFKRLTESGNVLLGLGGLAQQEREKAELLGEKISKVSSYLRAGKKNIGHVALIGGSVLALGLKLAGFGGDGPDPFFSGPEPIAEPEPEPAPAPEPLTESPVQPAPSDTSESNDQNADKPDDEVSEDTTQDIVEEPAGPSEDDMRAAIIEAGMPVVEDMDLDLQYRLAELLPTLEGMSDESRQYFEELYDRMDSDDPFVQGQAVKDYADLVLNCLGNIEGLDNKALAFEMISEAAMLAEDTNCQVLDFKAYMLLHGIGTEAVPDAAVEILMTSLTEHSSAEAARLLSYLYESGAVDPADHPGLEEVHNAMTEQTPEQTSETAPSSNPATDSRPGEAAGTASTAPAPEEIMEKGQAFTILNAHGDELSCQTTEEVSIAQAAYEIGNNQMDHFACDQTRAEPPAPGA